MAWGDYRSAFNGGAGSGTDYTASNPSGLAAGDLMVASVYTSPGTTVTTVPTGWVLWATETNPGDFELRVYLKIAEAGDISATWTWEFSASVFRFVHVWAFLDASGLDVTTANRQDGSSGTNQGDGQLLPAQTAPSIDTTETNSLLLFVYANSSGGTPTSLLGACTFRNANNGMTCGSALVDAGATGTTEPNEGGAGTENFVAIHIAVRETAAGGGGRPVKSNFMTLLGVQ